MQQVHKEELKSVPNALEDRDDVNLEIFGMEGIPPQMRQAYNQQVTQAYYKQEAEHRARTGNNLHSTGDEPAAKKPKFDDEARAELKKRVAEAKAKREAQKAAAAAGLPMPAEVASPAPPSVASPVPGLPPQHSPVAEQQAAPPFVAPPGYPPPFQPVPTPMYGAYNGHPLPGQPMPGYAPPLAGPPMPGYAPPPFHPLPHAASPPAWNHRPAHLPALPVSASPPAHYPSYPPPQGSNGLPPHQYHAPQVPASVRHTPLPPNLPARPGPPPASAVNGPGTPAFDLNKLMDEQSKIALERLNGKDANAEMIEKSQVATPPPVVQSDLPEKPAEKAAEKKEKAAKKKAVTRLVLSDNEVSWEELRANLTKYQKPLVPRVANADTVAGDVTDGVTGVVEVGAA